MHECDMLLNDRYESFNNMIEGVKKIPLVKGVDKEYIMQRILEKKKKEGLKINTLVKDMFGTIFNFSFHIFSKQPSILLIFSKWLFSYE